MDQWWEIRAECCLVWTLEESCDCEGCEREIQYNHTGIGDAAAAARAAKARVASGNATPRKLTIAQHSGGQCSDGLDGIVVAFVLEYYSNCQTSVEKTLRIFSLIFSEQD